MRIKAVIFDLDGTLCHYGIPVEEALEKAITSHSPELWSESNEKLTKENYNHAFWNVAEKRKEAAEFKYSTRIAAFKELLKLKEVNAEIDELVVLMAKTYTKIRVKSLKFFEEVEEVLEEVSSKFKLGLLTNGPSDTQWEKIRELKLDTWFEHIIVSGDLKVSKPQPPIFEKMLDKLGCSAQEALYVGDSLVYDVQGANNSGLISVWLNRDHQEPESGLPKPDYEINDLKGLLRLLI